jgi:hypothetical protein
LGPPLPPLRNDVVRERPRQPVSGPSFLGLGDERSRDLDYLLEDEPPSRGHGRLYLALLLLIVSGGLLAWHWQRDGYPWSGLIQKPAASRAPISPAPAPDSAIAAPPVVPVEPTANPAPPDTQPAPIETAPAPTVDSSAGSTPSAAATAAKPAEQTPQPNDSAAVPESASKPPAASSPQAASSQGGSQQAGSPQTGSPQTKPAQTAEPEATEEAPKEAQVATAIPMPKAVSPKPSPTAPGTTFEDRLVADGEKYLYGRGVPEDCARAQRNLQIAARASNAKAQTLLGAMYATGHCVGRDLPSAYRWFAKALHGDPSNSRVQRDLEVLWKQMTPEERQLAMKSQ